MNCYKEIVIKQILIELKKKLLKRHSEQIVIKSSIEWIVIILWSFQRNNSLKNSEPVLKAWLQCTEQKKDYTTLN